MWGHAHATSLGASSTFCLWFPFAKVPLAKARLITEPTVGVQGTEGMVAGRREHGRHFCRSSLTYTVK